MSNKLKLLGAIVLCVGIVGTGYLAATLGYEYIGLYTKQLNFGRFFGILVGGILVSAVTSSVLFFFGEVLDKLDEIIKRLNDKQ